MMLPAAPEMKAESFCAAAAIARPRWSAGLHPKRVSRCCSRVPCDSWRHWLAAPAECGRDGSTGARQTDCHSGRCRRIPMRIGKNHPARLFGIATNSEETAASEARALYLTFEKETPLMILLDNGMREKRPPTRRDPYLFRHRQEKMASKKLLPMDRQ